jgi:excisionase family DNA binding protein
MAVNLTLQEAANILSITTRTLTKLLEAGAFPGAFKIGDSVNSPWRIPQPDLETYIQSQAKKAHDK